MIDKFILDSSTTIINPYHMNKTPQLSEEQEAEKSRAEFETNLPLISKIEDIHIRNLESLIAMLCQLINEFAKAIDLHDLQLTSQQLAPKAILAIKDANNEIKYHQKISPIQREGFNVTVDIEQTLQLLAKLKVKEEGNLPKVKKFDESLQPASFGGQLSTITEKESEENLHNYLRMHHGKRRSKSNINKNNFLFNTSSIEDIEFEVIREETRKSLDNPFYKNNQTRKSLYNDLQRMKGQDNLLPAVKSYLDKHKKATNLSKPPQYVIQKLI